METNGEVGVVVTIPSRLHGDSWDTKKILQRAGVKFLGVSTDDPRFQCIQLPKGWNLVNKGPLISFIQDDQGRNRVCISHTYGDVNAECRFSILIDHKREETENVIIAKVQDGHAVIYETEAFFITDGDSTGAMGRAFDAAQGWLDMHYPEWRNPGKYWKPSWFQTVRDWLLAPVH